MKPVKRNIDDVADLIRPHIECIGKEAKRPFLFEDIRKACIDQRAFLFMLPEGDSFTVLKPMPNKIVQIWVAYSKNGDATKKYLPIIKKLCLEIGAERIEFETALDAMENYMPRFGWEKKYTVWRMALAPDLKPGASSAIGESIRSEPIPCSDK